MLSKIEIFKRMRIFNQHLVIITFIVIQYIALEGAWLQPFGR